MTIYDEMNESEQTEIDRDPAGLDSLTTASGNYFGYVFIVPLATPLPIELEADMVTEGPLLARLMPLASKQIEQDLVLVPVSGAELLALDRAWNLIQEAKQVAVLTDLPGAKYDVLFTQAKRQIGLRSVDWPSIEEAFRSRTVERQRTKDKEPWVAQPGKKKQRSGSNLRSEEDVLPTPPEASEDDVDDYTP